MPTLIHAQENTQRSECEKCCGQLYRMPRVTKCGGQAARQGHPGIVPSAFQPCSSFGHSQTNERLVPSRKSYLPGGHSALTWTYSVTRSTWIIFEFAVRGM